MRGHPSILQLVVAMNTGASMILRLLPLVGLLVVGLPSWGSAQAAPRGTGIIVAHPAQPAPEPARVDLAVESFATTATGANAAAELAAMRVLRALSTSGIAVGEARVLGTVLLPVYEREEVVAVNTIRGDRRLIGYRALTGIAVETADLARVGLLVDIAQGAGANRVQGVRFPGSELPFR